MVRKNLLRLHSLGRLGRLGGLGRRSSGSRHAGVGLAGHMREMPMGKEKSKVKKKADFGYRLLAPSGYLATGKNIQMQFWKL